MKNLFLLKEDISPFTVNKTPVAGWNTPMNLKEHKRFGEPKEEMFAALKTAVEAA